MVEINRDLAKKILEIVDCGLTNGLGEQKKGELCVEAAVCYAMGLPHGDEPPCVSPAVRTLKIRLNDSAWSSNTARASGMRRLAIAQLGTAGQLNDIEFVEAVAAMTIQKIVPRAFRNAARIAGKVMRVLLEEWAITIENEPTPENCNKAKIAVIEENAAAAADAYAAAAADAAAAAGAAAAYAAAAADAAAAAYAGAAAYAAAYAAYAANAAYAAAYAARDKELAFFAEEVVKILIDMKAEGTQWLDLTEVA